VNKKPGHIVKITRPDTRGIIPRERLFRILDRVEDFPVVWITGLPGSGKTALVASYLHARKKPCVWYQIDEGDSDIATFFYYTGIAVKNLHLKTQRPLPLFSSEFLQEMSVFTRRYFENLFHRFSSPFIFVLDNYQEVPLSAGFHEMIAHGLAAVPEGMQVMILSRKEPPPPFSIFSAQNKMQFIRWNDVRFTLDEAREILRFREQKDLAEETFLEIYRKTEGWIAGLTLLIESAKARDISYTTIAALHPVQVFDYFASEIFEKMEQDTKDFLLKTAFLPRMTAEMASKLTGKKQAGRILSQLYTSNCFLEMHTPLTPAYQYHSLFKEFLRSQAWQQFTRSKISRIRQAAARILEEKGQVEDAMHLYRELSDLPAITRLVLNNARFLIRQGRYQTLGEWLSYLPKTLSEGNPWLLYWEGLCCLPFQPDECRLHFEKAFSKFKSLQDAEGIFSSLSGIVESIMYGNTTLNNLDQWFLTTEQLLREFRKFPTEEIKGRVICSLLRAIALRRPAFFPMDEWAEQAYELVRRSHDATIKTELLIHLACYYYSGGDLQNMGMILDSLKELMKKPDIAPLAKINFLWLAAAYANFTSRYDDCINFISDGLAIASATGVHMLDFILLGHGALSSLKKGDFLTAETLLRRMLSSLNVAKPWETLFYQYVSIWTALYRKDYSQAMNQAEQCLFIAEEMGNPWMLHLIYIQRAFLFHILGKQELSDKELCKARDIGIQSGNAYAPFSCAFAEAYFASFAGDEEKVIAAIRTSMKIGKEKGFVNLYMWPQGVMGKVAARALDAGIEVQYVRELIKRNALLPDTVSFVPENWPWPLKIYTLGRFNIVKDEKPIEFIRKTQQKPLLLLKALIALGGRDVREDLITDFLWPDADGDAAHSAFGTTLFRLRHLLGSEHCIKVQDGRVFLDNQICWVDAWVFERILGQVELLMKREPEDTVPEIVRLTDKAVSLYKGHFLSSDDQYSWTISYRERLRVKFLRLVIKIGEYLEKNGDLKKAIECYERALTIDVLAEEFYQQLMICYCKLGQSNEAHMVYRRCREIFKAVLGVEPSSKTESLYRTLNEMDKTNKKTFPDLRQRTN
jgi:LuxR family transcriptional regulator, maltose regulon positive regulatory protein